MDRLKPAAMGTVILSWLPRKLGNQLGPNNQSID